MQSECISVHDRLTKEQSHYRQCHALPGTRWPHGETERAKRKERWWWWWGRVGGEGKRTTTSDCAYQVHGHQPTWQHRSGTSGAFVQAARLPHPLPPSTAIHVAARSVPRRACRPGRARISRTFTYDKMDWLYTSHGLIDKPSLWEGSEIMGWWACQQGVTSLWLTGVLSQLHSSIGECVGVSVR